MNETASLSRSESPAALPSRAWRRTSLAVPPLVVLAGVLFGVSTHLSSSRTHRRSSQCRWIPLSWDTWAVAYGGLAAALAAVGLHIWLRRRARARGWNQERTWQGALSTGFAVLGWVAVLLTAVAVVLTHSDASDYAAHHREPVCEGLAPPAR
ncbi:hypothetical protein [Streptomyces sp. NBC_01477]|uniref:hypothetical protein n=1 Tax=Streptomyces sp. NBC_01477 TaxID=2976015 RepID=UPI002E30387A|nr:hypothetical protein [Streptomyces sp. NBC_01477]